MEGVLTAKSEEKKQASKPASDSFSESAPRPAALGASAGLPLFLGGGVQKKIAAGASENSGVQFKCDCGGFSSGECEECRKKREEESHSDHQVQKKCATCEEEDEQVQHKQAAGGQAASVHGTARAGVARASQPLPHLDRIQSSFGRHDVSSARAEIGGPAAHANASMGALAYTAGDRIGFRREPDVKLAAHEAAHVVQQRSGAKLAGGVGRPGDAYERQADAVADAVDRGESAEPILDRTISSNPSGSEPVVQHALAINAFHLTEPPIAMTRPTIGSAPEPIGIGGRSEGATPAQGASQVAQSAIAQADKGAAPAPASQPAPPVGGTEADTSTGGSFRAYCYNADYPVPDDDSDEEPKDPDTTKAKEEVHPDLPRPDETDICPIEVAVNAQAPLSSTSAAGESKAISAASTVPSAKPGSPPSGEAAQKTAPLGEEEIQSGTEAAANAPSPLEDAIAQAEAGRDNAVASFADSDALTGTLSPRITALAAPVQFLSDSSTGGDLEQNRTAEARVSDFFGNASQRLFEGLTLATDVVPDQFGATAEVIKSNIGEAIGHQKDVLSANVETARAQALSTADAARAQVHADHNATVAAINEQADSAIDALISSHDGSIGAIDEIESASLDEVNATYSESYDAHVALGPEYADLAEARGQQYAEFYQGCKKYNPDGTEWKDGFFAGYLTNRRAQAEVNAANETVKGYRKSLTETANDQAAQAMKGRKKDRCGIIATGRRTRTAVDDRLTTLMDALEAGREESIAQANATRHTMVASITSGLSSALAALDLLEHDGKQSLDDTGYLQQLAVEQAAYASATAVQEAVAQAVENVESALAGLRATLGESPAPALEDLDRILAQAAVGLNGGIDLLLACVDASITSATARLEASGSAAFAALDSDAKTSSDRINSQSETFSSQMDSLAAGAASTFGTMRDRHAEQAQQTSDAGAEGFTEAEIGFQNACDKTLTAIDATLTQSEQHLAQDFQKQVGGLDDDTKTGIPFQARLAASKEQPAWKSVVAIILIIAIIIVVALVIGPAVIGAVGAAAAALGASAGVATAVGAIVGGAIVGALSSGAMTLVQNWASGQRLTKGLGHAMLIGALTGAAGGAIGLGVNAGLNAALSGGRLAMSAGAQFAVRAAVNVTSDSLLNIGQQMALTGHVDWGEFAQGVAMSLVLHGSRRVQAFQARVTAVGARGVAGGVSRLGGGVEPSAASARASEFAAKMEQHAATAQKESKEPLDWTRPTRAPEPAAAPPPPESTGKATPSEATPPAPAETKAAAPPPEAATPPAATPEAAVTPEPVESAATKVTGEHPSPAAVHEAEATTPSGPAAEPDVVPEIGPEPQSATKVGVDDHEMYVRRGSKGVEVGMCSGVCGPLKARIDEMQAALGEPDSKLHGQLEDLRTKATDLEQRIDRGELTKNEIEREITDLAARLRLAAEEHPLLGRSLEPDVPGTAGPLQAEALFDEPLTESEKGLTKGQLRQKHILEVQAERQHAARGASTEPEPVGRIPETPKAPLDLPEYQESIEAARRALANLPEAPGVKTTAGVEGSSPTRSGYKPTKQFPMAEEATERAVAEGHEAGRAPEPHEFDRSATAGSAGKVRGSHAEKQAAVLSPDDPVGVSKPMCSDCQAWFRQRAIDRGVPQVVADPDGTRVFMPDGTVHFQQHPEGFPGPRGNR